MTKLLHTFAKRHAPHVAAMMTPERGYDPKRHRTPDDLKKAGVIDGGLASFLDDCLSQEGQSGNKAAQELRAASPSGDHNEDAFIKELMGADALDDDGDDEADENVSADESIEA